MRAIGHLTLAILAAATIASAPAFAANMCQTDHLTCATTMPIDGYCECTKHGNTEGGTVVAKSGGHRMDNSTAGGCGDHPNAPGCR